MGRRITSTALALVALFALAGCGSKTEKPPVSGEPLKPTLRATLTGAAEVPGPGDPDGSGAVTLTLDPIGKQVCFTLIFSNLDAPNGMHIHKGPATGTGPVVVTMPPPSATQASVSGCVAVDEPVVAALAANPSDYYFNIHTAGFSNGAIRGQLSK